MDSTRKAEVQAFDDTKEGVKGLVDAKITEIPRIFHRPAKEINEISHFPSQSNFTYPVIDLQGIGTDSALRKEAVEQVGKASKNLGFFEVINHGTPAEILEEMKHGVKRFYEQDSEIKKEFDSRDLSKTVVYSNFDLFSAPFTNWRDTVLFHLAPIFQILKNCQLLAGQRLVVFFILFQLLSVERGRVLQRNIDGILEPGCKTGDYTI